MGIKIVAKKGWKPPVKAGGQAKSNADVKAGGRAKSYNY